MIMGIPSDRRPIKPPSTTTTWEDLKPRNKLIMEEQEPKQESEGLLIFKLIAGLAAAAYGLYLIFA